MNQILSRTFRPLAALALAAGCSSPTASTAQTAVSTLLGTWNAPTGGRSRAGRHRRRLRARTRST